MLYMHNIWFIAHTCTSGHSRVLKCNHSGGGNGLEACAISSLKPSHINLLLAKSMPDSAVVYESH